MKHHNLTRHSRITLWVGIASLALAGCAPEQLERALGTGAQIDEAGTTQVIDGPSGYPGPTAEPPTLPVPTSAPQLPFAPPEADQAVNIGAITEVTSLKLGQADRYAVERVLPKPPYTDPQPASVIIHDLQTGADIRLGDDHGNVEFEYLSEKYVLWDYFCLPETCQKELTFQTGLYAHKLETGENLWIGPAGEPEANEDWLIYSSQGKAVSPVTLRVRHLVTGEDFELSSELMTVPGYGTRSFFAINEGRVAWVEIDPATQARVLKTYDLNARTGQKLDVGTEFPRALAVSGSLVVWFDSYWQGYDLRQDSHFNVPAMPMPQELWDKPLYISVTVQGDMLQWTLDVDEGSDLFFTAQVFPPAQTPQPTPPEPATVVPVTTMPTTDSLPTALPEAPTAGPTALSTAYP